MTERMFGDLVKTVIDIEKEIFDNKNRNVDDPRIQKRIITIVEKLVSK